MISFSKLGKHGNLGNQLWQIASTIGIARKHGVQAVFPHWAPSANFKNKIPQQKSVKYDMQVDEPHYHYADMVLDVGKDVDLLGWLQSEKYFNPDDVAPYFEFTDKVIDRCMILDEQAFAGKVPVCAISIRRGDYIGNPNYYPLDMLYYAGAAMKVKEKVGDVNFLIFSDDLDWCMENVIKYDPFRDGKIFFTKTKTAIDQLACMSLCDHFVIANSSFSWWGAWLGERNNKNCMVIAPAKWNDGPLLAIADDKDVVPDRWHRWLPEKIVVKRTGRYDLKDVTFTIPIKLDHTDRRENLELCIRYLQNYFDTTIVVGEMDDQPRFEYLHNKVEYRFFKRKQLFERTWILNELCKEAQTPIVANWDADVFMQPEQVVECVERLRKGEADGCYPYDGRFFHASRKEYYKQLSETLDTEIFRNKPFSKNDHTVTSYGGCVMWNKEKFIAGGMENEHMVDYGPEDFERYHRFRKLGFKIGRVTGPLFHIDHALSRNGSQGHARYDQNHQEYDRLMKLTTHELRKEVNGWAWHKNIVKMKPMQGNDHCIWQTIKPDMVYLINLKNRTDKLEHARTELKSAGISPVYEYEAVDGYGLQLKSSMRALSPGMVGCYQSHQNILKQAIESGLNTIVVFEDDLQFVAGANDLMQLAFRNIPEDWQFAYIGSYEYGGITDYRKKVNDFWCIPKSVWGTHGYMIRGRDAIIKVANLLQEVKMQLDNQLSQIVLPASGLKYYSALPSIVDQWLHESSDVQVANPELKF